MGDHFIEKCKECGTVISQCRCMDQNKRVILNTCESCKEKAKRVEQEKKE